MKARFDGLDVTAMVAHLQASFTDRRVLNVYDGGDSDCYILKFDKATTSQAVVSAKVNNQDVEDSNGSRGFFLIESGKRFHPLTHFQAEASTMPSPFAAKLRKHIRGLRLSRVHQIGTDRVVVFSFGGGGAANTSFHLILELYDKGNLVLCDGQYTILALLRSHVYHDSKKVSGEATTTTTESSEAVAVQVGRAYPVAYATTVVSANSKPEPVGLLADDCTEWVKQQLLSNSNISSQKKKKKQSQLTLKTLLLHASSGVSHYGPALLEHCILAAQLDPHKALLEGEAAEETALLMLVESIPWQSLRTALVEEGQKVLDELTNTGAKGYIRYTLSERIGGADTDGNNDNNNDQSSPQKPPHKLFQEFLPYLFLQHSSTSLLELYDSFGDAVQDFYHQLASQKSTQRQNQLERAAHDKLHKIQLDQEARVVALNQEQELLQHQAEVVQQHASSVDAALTVINSALNSGMDWEQLEQLIQIEQTAGNPIASLVHELELEKDAMILKLPLLTLDKDHKSSDSSNNVLVEVSLKESAHANASRLFAKYRASKEKAAKTIDSLSLALKAAEENVKRQVDAAQKKHSKSASAAAAAGGGHRGKPAWFEKFHWFITSDNYLVLGGKDAHQNEMLVKRYLRPGDAYLHADVFGSTSTILRAKRQRSGGTGDGGGGKTKPVPLSQQALREAGNFTICRSSAWTSRMITSAWWVEAHQVSKTAPSGEYLTVGSFMIRGKKKFLPPTSLEMGIAVLFRLGDEESLARHKNERRDFSLLACLEQEDGGGGGGIIGSDDEDDVEHIAIVDRISTATLHRKAMVAIMIESEEQEEMAAIVTESPGDGKPSSRDTNVEDNDTQDVQGDSGSQQEENGERENQLEENRENAAAPPKQKKKGLSARDRKLIKKYGSLEEAERVLPSSRKQEQSHDMETSASQPPSITASAEQNGSAKRGKKAKLKRMKMKYCDQDEEDRDFAMLALQGGEKSKKKGRQTNHPTENQRKVASETTALLARDVSAAASQLPDAVRSVLAECVTVSTRDSTEAEVRWDKFDADVLEQLGALEPEEAQLAAANRLRSLKAQTRIDNFAASLGGIIRAIRKYGHEGITEQGSGAEKAKRKTKEEKQAETKEWKEALAEEGFVDSDADDDAVDDTAELNKLSGKPLPEDTLLYAVSVCAPYQTLSQYTYRVKLTPGNMKRGKAARQCVEMLAKTDAVKTSPLNERCIDLMKRVNENDWVQTICPEVKISAPGASKVVKSQKSKAKKATK